MNGQLWAAWEDLLEIVMLIEVWFRLIKHVVVTFGVSLITDSKDKVWV
jgi:hypothetical protein